MDESKEKLLDELKIQLVKYVRETYLTAYEDGKEKREIFEDGLNAEIQEQIAITVDGWVHRTTTDNPPLTLEQLRQMDKKPVWIEVLTNKALSQWVIISRQNQFTVFTSGGRLSFSLHGKTWLAYAHKPEQEEKP